MSGNEVEAHAVADLSLLSLSVAVSLVLVVALVSVKLRLRLSMLIGVATLRTVLQLLALGSLLYPIFAHNEWYVVLPYIALMVCFAAREASVKPKYFYTTIGLHFAIALGGAVAISFALCASLILQPHPWWDAQYMVPISGMLLGNSLTALSLGTDGYLKSLKEGATHECLLACGASRWEAVLPACQGALMTGLTPTLNSMSVIGLVSIPGMMTGTVLGGAPPIVAAKYQMMIMFVILFTSCASLSGTMLLATLHLSDAESRLHTHLIIKREGPKAPDILIASWQGLLALCRRLGALCGARSADLGELRAPLRTPSKSAAGRFVQRGARAKGETVLSLSGGVVLAPGDGAVLVAGADLTLSSSEQIVLFGPSGCGKSTLLKGIAGLMPMRGAVSLHARDAHATPSEQWRSRVVYVRQEGGVGLPGAPAELFQKLVQLKAQRARQPVSAAHAALRAALETLQLPDSLLAQEWSSLSGGQSQRVYLAMMVALKPSVLLLDEVSSGCDAHATLQVEALVAQSGAAAVWITHSAEQAARLASSRIDFTADSNC